MLIIRTITQGVVNLFKRSAQTLKWKSGGALRSQNDDAEVDLAGVRRDLKKLTQILAYQRTLIKSTKPNSYLQILSLPSSELEFAWLRIEYLTKRSVAFSVYHPTVSTGRFRNERLGSAAVEFNGDSALILNINIHPEFLTVGIAENLLAHIEREGAVRGKLFVKYITNFEQHSTIKSLDLLFTKTGFDPGSLGYGRNSFVKIIKYD